MACQIVHWLFAGAGPTTFQHALVGIGCVLAYDAVSRWWQRNRPSADDDALSPGQYASPADDEPDYRQAA